MKNCFNRLAVIAVIASFLSACANIPANKPIVLEQNSNKINVLNTLPKTLPTQSAVIPDSQYVMIQSKGGSIFLGPILSTINISANTKALANKYAGKYVGVSPFDVAMSSVKEHDMFAANTGLDLKPFVFVQECDDERFRLSLVYHMNTQNWVGRYIYHLPTSYTKDEFAKPDEASLSHYQSELQHGANTLIDLVQKDMAGKLAASGKKVDIGSLYLLGSKVGGLGIYTMPEELHLPNTDLVYEAEDHVVVRMNGDMSASGSFGGLIFGTHYFAKDQLHTYKEM